MDSFLVQVNRDSGFPNIMNNRLYENGRWMNKPRDRDHGMVKPGDELIIYCTSKVPNYGMSIAFSVIVKGVSSDRINFTLEAPRWFESPLKRDRIQNLVDQGVLPEVLLKCGQQGFNIAKLDPNSSQRVLGQLEGEALLESETGIQHLEMTANLPRDQQAYTVGDIIDDGCFLSEERLVTILGRLKDKKNLIFQGPPGTGKTWLARRIAFALIGSKSEFQVRPFQFHPNLSYEDFVRGWRPSNSGKLCLIDGPFLQAVKDAIQDPLKDFVVVIEEINRGNPAQVLGEMLTLLEADKRNVQESLTLSYADDPSERVHIPPNLYVIGTMNLADRSLALVDFALRRRFAFIDLEPVFGERWQNWVSKQAGIEVDFLVRVEDRLIELNRAISEDRTLGPPFQVGHSVVTPPPGASIGDPQEWFSQVVETEIRPHLEECWFEDPDRARTEKEKLLRELTV